MSAIFFADMVGYTLLMQENEQKAKLLRDQHRLVLQEESVAHGGTILQYYGDGTLCVFDSSIEAVKCAIDIQTRLSKEPKVPLRIGIHIGDVVHDDEGIYGDGVNVASRIESLSVAGSVLVSERVVEDVKSHPSIEFKNMGVFQLKNVRKPTGVFAIGNQPLVVPVSSQLKGKGEQKTKSVAVLPFVNMSTSKENEYFSDGITEELLNALTKVKGLQVTARTSSFAFKGKNIDIRDIGQQLNVEHILEGSVRKSGNKVRITAQLITTADGYHQWSQTFDRNLDDIFELQDELAHTIAHQLREKLGAEDVDQQPIGGTTKDPESYSLYLKGNYYWNKWSPDNIKKAIELYDKAIEKEPDFSLAHSGRAGCYVFLGITGNYPADLAFPRAKLSAEKAMELDPQDDKSLLTMAMFKFMYEKNTDSARRYFENALELNPNNSVTRQYYAMFLSTVGQQEQALKEVELAHQLDPLSLSILGTQGNAFLIFKMYEKAEVVFQSMLDMDPTFRTALEGLGWVNVQMKKWDKALKYFLKFQELTGSPLKGMSGLGYVYARTGQLQKAQECLDKLDQRSREDKETNLNIDYAVVYLGFKNWERTFLHIEKAIEANMGGMFLSVHPIWEEVREEPKFKALLEYSRTAQIKPSK